MDVYYHAQHLYQQLPQSSSRPNIIDRTDNLYHLNLPQDAGFESTEKAYDLKEMHRVVNTLPKEYKVPFAMHVSGFKYREIAEKLNLPLGTVKSRIFFTRQKLQEELKDFR